MQGGDTILSFFVEWGHILCGIICIGILYYINFVKIEFVMAEDTQTKSFLKEKLASKTIWSISLAAFFSLFAGFVFLYFYSLQPVKTTEIILGSIIGTLIMLNLWGIIWRNQKIIIDQKKGDVVSLFRQACLASRTNTLFSIPMLYLMISSIHSPTKSYFLGAPATGIDPGYLGIDFLIICLVIFSIELNAIFGKMHLFISTEGTVLTSSFVLMIFFLGLGVIA